MLRFISQQDNSRETKRILAEIRKTEAAIRTDIWRLHQRLREHLDDEGKCQIPHKA